MGSGDLGAGQGSMSGPRPVAHRPSRRLLFGALPPELTLAQVARECGVSKVAVWKWRGRANNPLPSYQDPAGTGRWLVALVALRQWLGLDPEEAQ